MEPPSPLSSLPESLDPGGEAGGPPGAEPGCAEGFYTPRDLRNQRRFNAWLLGASLAYAAATFAFRRRESIPEALPWLVTALCLGLTVQATRSYLVFLRGADELLRRIQTDALAFGFALGAAFSVLYPLLEKLGAPKLDQEVTGVIMMVSWSAGLWIGIRRYSRRQAE